MVSTLLTMNATIFTRELKRVETTRRMEVLQRLRHFASFWPWIWRGTSYAAINLDDSGSDGAAVWVPIVLVPWYSDGKWGNFPSHFLASMQEMNKQNNDQYANGVSDRREFSQMVEVWELEYVGIIECWSISWPVEFLCWASNAPVFCSKWPHLGFNLGSSSAYAQKRLSKCIEQLKLIGWAKCTMFLSLRIQVCPKEGITPTFLLWGWDWDHQSYEKSGGVWMLRE